MKREGTENRSIEKIIEMWHNQIKANKEMFEVCRNEIIC